MSKFQKGDYVQHREKAHWRGEVRTAGLLMTLTCGLGSFVDHEGFDLVAKAGEWVPDVDGNPIRVGALVEHHRGGLIVRVDDVFPTAHTFASGEAVHTAAHFHALTPDDLHRPPEPPTRDVTLRVTDKRLNGSDAKDWPGRVEKRLRDVWPDITVEVIEDGDSHA